MSINLRIIASHIWGLVLKCRADNYECYVSTDTGSNVRVRWKKWVSVGVGIPPSLGCVKKTFFGPNFSLVEVIIRFGPICLKKKF